MKSTRVFNFNFGEVAMLGSLADDLADAGEFVGGEQRFAFGTIGDIGDGGSCAGGLAGVIFWPERSCSCNTSRASANRAGIDLPVSRDSVANKPFCSGVSSKGVDAIDGLYQEKPAFAMTAADGLPSPPQAIWDT